MERNIFTSKDLFSNHPIVILVIAIVINCLTLWVGRGLADNGLALFEPIRQSEVAQMYARTHPVSYSIWASSHASGNPSGNEHWAKDQMAFFESRTGISLNNPDGEANLGLLNEQLGIKTMSNLRLSWFAQQLVYKSYIGIVLLILLIPLSIRNKYSKKDNLLAVTAISIAFGTVSLINSLLLIGIYVLILKKVTLEISKELTKAFIIEIIGAVFCAGILCAMSILKGLDSINIIMSLMFFAVGITIAVFMIIALFYFPKCEKYFLN